MSLSINNRIRFLRKELGLTLQEVGNLVGVGKSTVRKWETGDIANIRSDKIPMLAKALKVTPSYLMGWDETVFPSPIYSDDYTPSSLYLPLLGDVVAGMPLPANQQYDSFIITNNNIKCDFTFKVQGDSMEPLFLENDIIFLRSQGDVDDGQIAVIVIDDDATLKRVYHLPDGIRLVSDNPKYPPMVFNSTNSNNARILGLVVGYYRKVY